MSDVFGVSIQNVARNDFSCHPSIIAAELERLQTTSGDVGLRMKPFDAPFWQTTVLVELSKAPDTQLDRSLALRMKEFSEAPNKTPVEVWNFYKEMLDMCVHIGGGSSLMVVLLDLEDHYIPPVGALLRNDGTIKNAPWRR